MILEAQIPELPLGQPLQRLHRPADRAGLELAPAAAALGRAQRRVERRLANVQEIYNTADLGRAQQLLDHYGVRYIVVGELERAYYTPRGWRSSSNGAAGVPAAGSIAEAQSVTIYEVSRA